MKESAHKSFTRVSVKKKERERERERAERDKDWIFHVVPIFVSEQEREKVKEWILTTHTWVCGRERDF